MSYALWGPEPRVSSDRWVYSLVLQYYYFVSLIRGRGVKLIKCYTTLEWPLITVLYRHKHSRRLRHRRHSHSLYIIY